MQNNEGGVLNGINYSRSIKEKILGSNPVNIIDVRTDEETAMGTIPGAKTIPMDQIAIT